MYKSNFIIHKQSLEFFQLLQLIMSSDKLSSIREPVASVDFHIEEGQQKRHVSVELSKEQLKNVISSLEAANKVSGESQEFMLELIQRKVPRFTSQLFKFSLRNQVVNILDTQGCCCWGLDISVLWHFLNSKNMFFCVDHSGSCTLVKILKLSQFWQILLNWIEQFNWSCTYFATCLFYRLWFNWKVEATKFRSTVLWMIKYKTPTRTRTTVLVFFLSWIWHCKNHMSHTVNFIINTSMQTTEHLWHLITVSDIIIECISCKSYICTADKEYKWILTVMKQLK